MDAKGPSVSSSLAARLARNPVGTLISCCVIFALGLECFLATLTDRPYARLVDATSASASASGSASASASGLSSEDYATLLNVTDFRFRINNLPCDVATPDVIVLVHSATTNRERRDAVRQTWGAEARTSAAFKVLFVLGETHSSEGQLDIERENGVHLDIVQGTFIDSYTNMTYKHTATLKWLLYHCPKARVFAKVDDDSFLNTGAVLEFFAQDLPPSWTQGLMLCNPATILHVVRDPHKKWFVPREAYARDTYPPYCLGGYIFYSADVALALYHEAQRTPYYWIDDVHVTGTLAEQVKVTLTSLGSLSLSPYQVDEIVRERVLKAVAKTRRGVFWAGCPGMSVEAIRGVWNATVDDDGLGRPFKNLHIALRPVP